MVMRTINTDFREIRVGTLRGSVSVPPSKSISHRMLILGAISEKECIVKHLLLSDDVEITLNTLRKLGYVIELKGDTAYFNGEREIVSTPISINFGDSGTTARFLTALAAGLPGEYILDGSSRMRERPMAPLINALKDLKVSIKSTNGYLPIHLKGEILQGGEVHVDVNQSSQYMSALMLVAPLTERGLKIFPSGEIASKSYADLTIAMLEQNGIRMEKNDSYVYITGNQRPTLTKNTVEGDFSSAAYFAVGAAISGGKVYIENINRTSWQGDRIILDVLKEAGVNVLWDEKGVYITAGTLRGIEMDMISVPDLVPTVAVMALFAEGKSEFRNVAHLRIKESDRLSAIVNNINNLGGSALVEGSDLTIKPKALKGSLIQTYNDHRIAMSFALAGLCVPNTQIENPNCVTKSFPNFWCELDRLTHPD